MGKNNPGMCEREISGAIPESSVAVGSIHVTVVPVEVGGIVRLIVPGQPLMTGGSVSLAVK